MKQYMVGQDRSQSTLFPEVLDDYIAEDNPVRVVDVFVDELDLKDLAFDGAEPEATGRPAYHPATMLKIYIYGYLNRIQSSRRLERETQRNVELIWLTGRLAPDFKKEPRQGGALRSSSSASTAAEGGYSTLAQMNTVELCLPVIGLLLGPVLIYKDFPSMLN